MATLKKILIHVPSDLCDGFKSKYVKAANRSTIYDNKVVFLEKTREIFTQGKLYGTTFEDFNALKTLVGTLPAGATSKNLVDYINEMVSNANHIHSISTKPGETFITVTTDANKDAIISYSSDLSEAVSNAAGALQSIEVLGYTLKKNTKNSLTVNEAKQALELKSAAFENTSYFDKAGTAQGLINALGGSASSTNGTYVKVKVDTSKGQASAVTVTETDALKNAVPLANSALQSVEVLGKELNKYDNSLTVTEAKSYLGLGSASQKNTDYFIGYEGIGYTSDTIWGAKAYVNTLIGNYSDGRDANTIWGAKSYAIGEAQNAYSYAISYIIGNGNDSDSTYTLNGVRKFVENMGRAIKDKFPAVTAGTGITVTPTTNPNGNTNYEISTYPDIFHYKGNVTTLEKLPSTDQIKGDVWSVGKDKAAGSILYAWDGDEWINIGSPNSVTGVDERPSKGIKLTRTVDGRVQVNVFPGSVVSGNTSVVTGGQVWEMCEPKGKAQELIDNLSNSVKSTNGKYVNVKVGTSEGNVSSVTVTENSSLTTAIPLATSAVQSVSVLGKNLSKNDNSLTAEEAKTFLGLKSAAYAETSAFDAAGAAADVKTELIGDISDAPAADTIYAAKNYADNVTASTVKTELIGDISDAPAADTIYAAKNYADYVTTAAEGRCDAKGTAQNLINNLSYKTVTSNSAYINSYVTSYRGQVTNISVTPGETLNIACSYALNSIQNIKAAYNSTSAASSYLTVSYATSGNYKTIYIDLNIEKVVQAVRDRLGI